MEGSHGEAADRKHQKAVSGSTKAKYFAFLNEESSWSADNSSQSEEDPYVKAKLRWWPRAWMSQSVNATFVHYRRRWDSATDIQKLQL